MNFDDKIKRVLGKSKNTSLPKFNFPKLNLNTKSKFGASLGMQKKWASFNSTKRNLLRKRLSDTDGDRVPNKFDCSPFNIMRQDWEYRGKQYPDIVDITEEYNRKNKYKKFKEVSRFNKKIKPTPKRHATAIIDTMDVVTPGTKDFLINKKIAIRTGEKITDDLSIGFGSSRAGGYVGFYEDNHPGVKGVIEQPNTKLYKLKDRQNLKSNILTFHHEIAHAKREAAMREKGEEPFKKYEKAWEVKPTTTETINEKGNKTTIYSSDITPIADYEIEAVKYEKRIDRKLKSKDIDLDKLYEDKYNRTNELEETQEEFENINLQELDSNQVDMEELRDDILEGDLD